MGGCVYKFVNRVGETIYIGSTGNFTKRMYAHFHNMNNGKMRKPQYDEVDRILFCNLETRNDAYILENYLIQKYKPKYNTASVNSGKITIVHIAEQSYLWQEKCADYYRNGKNKHNFCGSNQYSITREMLEKTIESLSHDVAKQEKEIEELQRLLSAREEELDRRLRAINNRDAALAFCGIEMDGEWLW